jgi:hypothetical protein
MAIVQLADGTIATSGVVYRPLPRGTMEILSAVLIVLVLAMVGLGVAAMRQPNDFRISRSTRIAADPAAVFVKINDFRAWPDWSPWAKLDPTMHVEYDGPSRGLGAGYAWSGNSKVRHGSMRIIESKSNTKVKIQLEFIKPFRASNQMRFTLAPDPNGTRVSWTMEGDNQLFAKLTGLFMNMDKRIGRDFERGLASLKEAVEHAARRDSDKAAPRVSGRPSDQSGLHLLRDA